MNQEHKHHSSIKLCHCIDQSIWWQCYPISSSFAYLACLDDEFLRASTISHYIFMVWSKHTDVIIQKNGYNNDNNSGLSCSRPHPTWPWTHPGMRYPQHSVLSECGKVRGGVTSMENCYLREISSKVWEPWSGETRDHRNQWRDELVFQNFKQKSHPG